MKTYMGRFAAIVLAVFMIAPLAMAGYSNPNYRQAEPSTNWDVGEGAADTYTNFDETHALITGADHAYLNGFPGIYLTGPSPTLTDGDSTTPPQMLWFHAMMGYWRDCNGDGFVGSAALGLETYPAALETVDSALCPAGSGYVDDSGQGWVSEFRWIGPNYDYENPTANEDEYGRTELYDNDEFNVWVNASGPISDETGHRDILDSGARVWADFNTPDATPRATGALVPLPKNSLQTWENNLRLVDDLTFQQLSGKLGEFGVDYESVVGVGQALDSAGVPSPLKIAKDLYNSSSSAEGGDANCGGAGQSDCTGAYAQPFIVIWDCENASETEGTRIGPLPPEAGGGYKYVIPPVSVGAPNTDGTITGTYYQLNRGLPAVDGVRDGYGPQDEKNDQVGCDDEASPSPTYSNLERTGSAGQDTPLKTDVQVDFDFYPTGRLYEGGEGDERRQNGEFYPVPYTGLVDGANYIQEPATIFSRGWKANVVYVTIPGIGNPLVNLQEFYAADITTFFGFVSQEGLDAAPSGNGKVPISGAQYGDIHCPDGFGPGLAGEYWDCDPNSGLDAEGNDDPTVDGWGDYYNEDPHWNVVVGQPYNLRDVDCYENGFAGVVIPGDVRAELGGFACANNPNL